MARMRSFGARMARKPKVLVVRGRSSGIALITSQAFYTASSTEMKAWAVPGVVLGLVRPGRVEMV